MRTPVFIDLINQNLTRRNPAGTEYECLFFGYSDSFEYDEHERRCWQAALIRSDLGAIALEGRIGYHFFVAATDVRSGAHINTLRPETTDLPLSIPGLIQGDEAVIGANGLVHVRVQGLALRPCYPDMF